MAAVREPGVPRRPGVLRRHRDLRLLWVGATVSFAGDAVTRLALPLVAVITLRATPGQVGFLVAAQTVGWLLVALPAGAWVDRVRRRPVMVAGDLLGAALIGSIPIAAAAGGLTLTQLYVVALLAGCLAVTTNLAATAYLPSIAPPEDLAAANAAVQASNSLALVAGPSMGGALVQLVGAPTAVIADAVSFAVSATAVGAIRHREPPPDPPERHVATEIADGVRHTFGHPLLRAIAFTGGLGNLTNSALLTVSVVFLVRGLGLAASVVGALFAASGVGGVLGALAAPRVIGRLGLVRALWLPMAATGVFALLMPLTSDGPLLAAFAIGGLVSPFGAVVFNVAVATYVQQQAGPAMLGRTIASIRVVSRGALAFGGLLGGGVATWLPLRDAMWVVCAGLAASAGPILWAAGVRGARSGDR
jgi:MFS family permease